MKKDELLIEIRKILKEELKDFVKKDDLKEELKDFVKKDDLKNTLNTTINTALKPIVIELSKVKSNVNKIEKSLNISYYSIEQELNDLMKKHLHP